MASADILIKSDTYWSSVNCFAMLELPYEERCEFVHRAKRCEHSMNLVPYLELLACRFRCRNQFEELVYIALLLFFSSELIICLGYVLHYYFMPMLRTVAKMLHMNDHLAGVTIIALGNTLPKLFVNWSGRELKTLVASQLSQRFSLFLFVAMFSGGLICYMRPLRMNSHRTIRDLLFFIYGLTLMEYISINDGTISFPEYLLLIFVYCFYLTVNVLDLYMQHISMKSLRRQIQAQTTNVQVIQEKYYILVQDLRVCTPCRSYTNSICHEFQNIQKEPCLGLSFCKLKDWQRANALIRAFYIARAPIVWLCMIYIPMVDCERAGHGWRKLLNSMQICLNPALTIALMFRDTSMWSLYVLYSLLLTLPLCLFVLVRSDARVAPKYHSIFVILNLIGCLFIIHHLVKEISLILELIGTLRHMPDYFIDVTVAPIASGLTDLVTSFSLCKQGYERMAYAAAIGGTFLNIILGKDGSLITAIIIYGINPNAKLINIYCENAFILLILGLLSMLLLISLFKFNVQRSLGIYSMSIYLLYLLFTTLVMKWTFHTFKINFSFNTQGSGSIINI